MASAGAALSVDNRGGATDPSLGHVDARPDEEPDARLALCSQVVGNIVVSESEAEAGSWVERISANISLAFDRPCRDGAVEVTSFAGDYAVVHSECKGEIGFRIDLRILPSIAVGPDEAP